MKSPNNKRSEGQTPHLWVITELRIILYQYRNVSVFSRIKGHISCYELLAIALAGIPKNCLVNQLTMG